MGDKGKMLGLCDDIGSKGDAHSISWLGGCCTMVVGAKQNHTVVVTSSDELNGLIHIKGKLVLLCYLEHH